MWEYNYTNELYHHGILGMKWGVRRYQNKDGTLTPAGKKRAAKMEKNYQELTGKNLKRVNSAAKARAAKTSSENDVFKKLSEMSDDEIKAKIDRLDLENRYMKAYAERNLQNQSKGKEFVKNLLLNNTSEVVKDLGKQVLKYYGVTAINKMIGEQAVKK